MRRPDKTGHFRTLWLWEAWAGVWDARVGESTEEAQTEGRDAAATLDDTMLAESMMMVSCSFVRTGVPPLQMH